MALVNVFENIPFASGHIPAAKNGCRVVRPSFASACFPIPLENCVSDGPSTKKYFQNYVILSESKESSICRSFVTRSNRLKLERYIETFLFAGETSEPDFSIEWKNRGEVERELLNPDLNFATRALSEANENASIKIAIRKMNA